MKTIPITTSLKKYLINYIKALLSWAGYTVHRVQETREQPSIVAEPFDVVHFKGAFPSRCPAQPQVLFKCPVEHCVSSNGFSHGAGSWHAFSTTLEEYRTGECTTYEGSLLQRYYEVWQPSSSLEALIGLDRTPAALAEAPPYMFLLPWNRDTLEQRKSASRKGIWEENARWGDGNIVADEGCVFHGPVSARKGRIEFERLVSVFESIQKNGYDLSMGRPVRVNILKRGKELRYLIMEGQHRVAAMCAVGHATIPAVVGQAWVTDIDFVEFWPQVRDGIWSKKDAENYFNHLFDFDARTWAQQRNLL